MVRIRKRSLAASCSSGKQELPEISSNGGLHLYAGPNSNPSFLDPKLSSLLSSPGIGKQDHSLLADARYGVTSARPAPKQVPAETASVKSKPYRVFASICEVRREKNDEGLLVMKKGGNLRAMMDHAQESEVKHMQYMHDGADDDDDAKCMDIKDVSKAAASASNYSKEGAGRGEKAGAHKKGSRIDAPCNIIELPCSNPVITADATEYPRKVLPLRLILMSSESRSPAANIPAHNIINNNHKYLPSNGSTVSMPSPSPSPPLKPKDTTHVEEKVSPTCRKTRNLPSSAGGSFKHDLPELAGVRQLQVESIKLTSDEDANRCSQNTIDETSERPVSSWQGHRRTRSIPQGGRDLAGFNGTPDRVTRVRPCVNAESNAVVGKANQINIERKKKKLIQTKIKSATKKKVESLDNIGNHLSLQTLKPSSSTAVLLFDGKLKNHLVAKSDQSLPPGVQDVPIPEELIGSVIGKPKVVSKKRKRAMIITDEDPVGAMPVTHVASACAPAQDHLQADFMRCRRKDGRRWRCKEQVVKLGAPFCHYHTLKMKEKHATSVIRRLSKQLKGEAEISNYAESSRRDKIKRARKRPRRVMSSPESMAMQGRYGRAGMQRSQEEGEGDEEEDDDEEEEDYKEEEGQHEHAMLGKHQLKALQEATSLTTVKRRWRKKCKPCIRRLHDIHARAGPSVTDGLDSMNSFYEDTSNANKATRLPSPLPECLLNTDPNEWRSDFP